MSVKTPTIYVLQGLPGSGKTTYARKMLDERGHDSIVRINQDDIRAMLAFVSKDGSGRQWDKSLEKFVKEVKIDILARVLLNGKDVVIDDCNLGSKNKSMWEAHAKDFGANIEFIQMDTSVQECIDRDFLRDVRVGEKVIMDMARQHGILAVPESNPVPHQQNGTYVICDLDGTICDCRHRLPHILQAKPKNWKAFYESIPQDTFRKDVWEQVQSHGLPIILVTGRSEEYRSITLKWLADHGVKFNGLFMRKRNDFRPDYVVKQEILDNYLQADRVAIAYDDRDTILDMWSRNGIPVVDVGMEEFKN